MIDNVGSIEYDARIDSKNFGSQADAVEKRAKGVADNMEQSATRGFSTFSSQAASSFGSVADGLGRIIKSAVIIGTTGSVGIGAMAKASWDQVSAVQQATLALNAYEKDTGKVNKTLSELVAYARSDLGVLFNRKDLFAAAQQLKIMGDNTDSLTSHVKIMSRSVGLGLSTWEGLGNVINRVGSTGMLYADDLKYLQNAGFKLDSTMSGTTQTFESLFAALDKGIPADAMAGQADTIVGMGVRLQTAFRNIGDAILEVDADSGKFITGGLGDRLVGVLASITNMLKTPALKDGFRKMGQGIGSFVETALPKLIEGFTWVVNNYQLVVTGIYALVAAFVAAKVAAIAFSIAATANPVGLIAAAVVALVAALVFLQVRFDIFGKALAFLQPLMQPIIDAFQSQLLPILIKVGKATRDFIKYGISKLIEGFNMIKPELKAVALVMGDLIVNGINKLREAYEKIRPFLEAHKEEIKTIGKVIAIALLIPLALAVLAVAALALAFSAAVSILGNVVSWLVDFFKVSWDLMKIYWKTFVDSFNVGVQLVVGYINLTGSTINWLVGVVGLAVSLYKAYWQFWTDYFIGAANLIIGTINNVGRFFGMLAGWMGNAMGLMNAYIANGVNGAVGLFNSMVSKITGVFAGAGGWLVGVGKSIVDGLVNGIKSGIGAVADAAQSVANTAVKSAKNALGIKSPSKVFAGIGMNVVEGFSQGVDKNTSMASGSINGMFGASVPSFTPSSSSLSSLDSVNTGRSSGGGVTVNLSLSGIMARSKSDERDIAKNLIRTVNEELSAKGVALIGEGNI